MATATKSAKSVELVKERTNGKARRQSGSLVPAETVKVWRVLHKGNTVCETETRAGAVVFVRAFGSACEVVKVWRVTLKATAAK